MHPDTFVSACHALPRVPRCFTLLVALMFTLLRAVPVRCCPSGLPLPFEGAVRNSMAGSTHGVVKVTDGTQSYVV